MSTFTVHDFAALLRDNEELANEFLLGDEGFLEKRIVRRIGKDGFKLTKAGWSLVRAIGHCAEERAA